ncbi:MAG: hypothetical protein ABFD77_00775 [Thermotogota bacterium]
MQRQGGIDLPPWDSPWEPILDYDINAAFFRHYGPWHIIHIGSRITPDRMTTLLGFATDASVLVVADRAGSKKGGGIVDADQLKIACANERCAIASNGSLAFTNQILARLFDVEKWLPGPEELGTFNIERRIRDNHPHSLDQSTPNWIVEAIASLREGFRRLAEKRPKETQEKNPFEAGFLVGGLFDADEHSGAGPRVAVIDKDHTKPAFYWPGDVALNSPGATDELRQRAPSLLSGQECSLDEALRTIFSECARCAPDKCSARYIWTLIPDEGMEIHEPN